MFYRKCVNNQVFYRKGDPHPYCKNACEDRTMCGEVQVPEDHLEVNLAEKIWQIMTINK